MKVNERLKLVINTLKAKKEISTQKDFGYSLGFETESAFSQVVNGKVPFSETLYSRIETLYPNINIAWLRNGDGEMLRDTEIQIRNIKNRGGNVSIGNEIKSLSQEVYEKEVIGYEVGIPYYNIDFINGFRGIEEITRYSPEYKINYPPANHCEFWVNATGESMKGVIDNGDKIALKIVDKKWFPLGEVYAIITTNGHRMVKKITHSEDRECYRLVSANPNKNEFPDQDIPKNMIQTLFKVVTAIRFVR